MDSVTLTKQNRLFWLGRYAERVATMIPYLVSIYDDILDGSAQDPAVVCGKLGIPYVYGDLEDFCRRYTFDANDPCSVRSSAENMLGNGMVLRETISSETLAYLQMARNAIVEAENSEAIAVALQTAVDHIMAFRGSFDDVIVSTEIRNVIKVGRSVERLSLMLRLGITPEKLAVELEKLLIRTERARMVPSFSAMQTVEACAEEPETCDKAALLRAVEGLFQL